MPSSNYSSLPSTRPSLVFSPYILNDDYSLKRSLKVKHTTPHGLSVTTKNEHKKGVSAAIEAKYFAPQAQISIDKLSV
ncbi:unnamed protein product, partial [Sphacelaria rigidula]